MSSPSAEFALYDDGGGFREEGVKWRLEQRPMNQEDMAALMAIFRGGTQRNDDSTADDSAAPDDSSPTVYRVTARTAACALQKAMQSGLYHPELICAMLDALSVFPALAESLLKRIAHFAQFFQAGAEHDTARLYFLNGVRMWLSKPDLEPQIRLAAYDCVYEIHWTDAQLDEELLAVIEDGGAHFRWQAGRILRRAPFDAVKHRETLADLARTRKPCRLAGALLAASRDKAVLGEVVEAAYRPGVLLDYYLAHALRRVARTLGVLPAKFVPASRRSALQQSSTRAESAWKLWGTYPFEPETILPHLVAHVGQTNSAADSICNGSEKSADVASLAAVRLLGRLRSLYTVAAGKERDTKGIDGIRALLVRLARARAESRAAVLPVLAAELQTVPEQTNPAAAEALRLLCLDIDGGPGYGVFLPFYGPFLDLSGEAAKLAVRAVAKAGREAGPYRTKLYGHVGEIPEAAAALAGVVQGDLADVTSLCADMPPQILKAGLVGKRAWAEVVGTLGEKCGDTLRAVDPSTRRRLSTTMKGIAIADGHSSAAVRKAVGALAVEA